MEVLCSMPRESIRFERSFCLTDSRLIANGFKIKVVPGMKWHPTLFVFFNLSIQCFVSAFFSYFNRRMMSELSFM